MTAICPRFARIFMFCFTVVSLSVLQFSAEGCLFAQESDSSSREKVIIEREPLRVLAPEKYLFRFQLEPILRIQINAPMNGAVAQISVKQGDEVGSGQQLIRMDDRALELQLKIAEASSGAAAKFEKELARLRLEQSQLTAPFEGRIEKVHVLESVFVVAGTPLVSLVDDSRLQVMVPMERSAVNQGEEVELEIEGETYKARITYSEALPKKYETLRDLSKSVVAVTCEIENSNHSLEIGQAVSSPLVPRYPVVEVPVESLDNGKEGGRIVKILREQTVREVSVKTLGQVSSERLFVSGMFAPEDQLITKSSKSLEPGTVVQSPTGQNQKKKAWNSGSSSKNKSSKKNSPAF